MGAAVYPDGRRAAIAHEGADVVQAGVQRGGVGDAAHEPAADDHAVGDLRPPAATCSGVPMPKPTATGTSAAARTCSTTSPSSGGSSRAFAGDAGHRHDVDEAAGGLARSARPRPAGWSARRAGRARCPAPSQAARSSPASAAGRSGTIRPDDPCVRQRVDDALEAAREQRVRVTHQHHGDVAAASGAATSSRTRSNVAPRLQRALAGGLDRGAVGERVGERDAELDQVGAGSA